MEDSVLIVDDNRRVADAIARLVARRSFKPVIASTPDCVEQALVHCYAAGALLDVWLGGGVTGLDVANVLNARSEESPPLIAFMTAYEIGDPLLSRASTTAILRKPVRAAALDPFLTRVAVRCARLPRVLEAAVCTVVTELHLSAQEARVVAGLSSGATRSQLNVACGMDPNTLKYHIKRLLAKAGLSDTQELLARVLRVMSGRMSPGS